MEHSLEQDRQMQVEDKVEHYLTTISKNNSLLLKLSEAGLDRFLEDELYFNAGAFLLLRSVTSCVNLGIHIVVTHGLTKPKGVFELFDILALREIIPQDLAEKLRALVRIRDQLTLLDPNLDMLDVFNAIRHNLTDIVAFQKHVMTWLHPTR